MDYTEIPLGLAMAMAMRPEIMQKFTNLTETQKQQVINGTHSLKSKSEMEKYAEKILTEY